MKEYWNKILKFNDKNFPNWRQQVKGITSSVYFSNALAGEVGEICNMTKHMVGGGTNRHEVNRFDLALEIVDVFIYLVLLTEGIGFGLQEFDIAFNDKLRELDKRLKK